MDPLKLDDVDNVGNVEQNQSNDFEDLPNLEFVHPDHRQQLHNPFTDVQLVPENHSSVDILKYVCGRNRRVRRRPQISSDAWSKRISTDLKELQNDQDFNILAELSDDDIYNWDISFPAPNGKCVTAILQFNEDYPLVPPKMFIKQRIFHPNISMRGEVCLQNLKDNWTPAYSILSFILSVQYMLSEPNPDDAINPVAAKSMRETPDEFDKNLLISFEMLDLFTVEESDNVEESDDNSEADTENAENVDAKLLELEDEVLLEQYLESLYLN